MATTAENQTLLGREITKRLNQLRLSRREFVRRSGLSRQTLHNIEREGYTELWASTFRALDTGLGWPSGTAQALAHGDESALETLAGDESNIMVTRESLLSRVAEMPPDELELLTRVLETRLFGRTATSMRDHVELMERAMRALDEIGQQGRGNVVG